MLRDMRTLIGSGLIPVGLLLVGACGVQVGDDPRDVGTAKLEKQLSDGLLKQIGQRPDTIDCPKPLPAKKGATVRCTITAGTDKLGVTATTKSVDASGEVNYGFEVDDRIGG